MEKLVRNFIVLLIRYIYRDNREFGDSFVNALNESLETGVKSYPFEEGKNSDKTLWAFSRAFYEQASLIGIIVSFAIIYGIVVLIRQ